MIKNNNLSELIPPPDFQMNQKLGRIIVGTPVGRNIYHAHDPLRGFDTCIKVVNGDCEQAKQMLEDEFRLLDRFSGSGYVVKVFDMHEVDYGPGKLLVMSMEYTPDSSLANWITINRNNFELRRQEGMRYLAELINAIEFLYSNGFVYYTIDPGNILIFDAHLKLSDMIDWSSYSGSVCVNSNNYELAAPELFIATKASELNFSAVIYSLGAILYQMFSEIGEVPYVGTFQQVREKHLYLPIPRVGIDLVDKVIQRSMAKLPDQRYQNIEELKSDLINISSAASQVVMDVDAMCVKISDLINNSQWQDAYDLCQEVLVIFPDHESINNIANELETKKSDLNNCMEKLKDKFGNNPISNDLELLNKAVMINGQPTEEMYSIAASIERRQAEYDQYFHNCKTAISRQEWGLALNCIELALRVNNNDVETLFWLNLIKDIMEVKRNMESAMQNSNTDAAVFFAEKLDKYFIDLGLLQVEENITQE